MSISYNTKKAAQAIAKDEKRNAFPLSRINQNWYRSGIGERVFPGDHFDIGRGHGKGLNTRILSIEPLLYIYQQGLAADVPFGALPDEVYTYTDSTESHDLSNTFPYYFWDNKKRDL